MLIFHQSVLLQTLELVGFKLNVDKSEVEPVQDIQFHSVRLQLDLGRAVLPDSKAGRCRTCLQPINPAFPVISSSVCLHGVSPWGFRSHLAGSAPETATVTYISTQWVRPSSLLHPAGLTSQIFNHYCSRGRACPSSLLESLSDLSSWIQPFLWMPVHRGGVPIWGIPRFLEPGPEQTTSSTSTLWNDDKPHINSLELKVICLAQLGPSATRPQGHDCYAQHHGSVLYQQARGTQSYSLLHLVVNLLL